jgi:hypothetical protein
LVERNSSANPAEKCCIGGVTLDIPIPLMYCFGHWR